MAASGESQSHQVAHAATYGGFLKLLKVGTIATIIVAAFVVFLIAS